MKPREAAPGTYPETLARARIAPAGANVPSQKDRERAAAHIGKEVGETPEAPAAKGKGDGNGDD